MKREDSAFVRAMRNVPVTTNDTHAVDSEDYFETGRVDEP